jgi:hypothetical protein
LFDKPVAELQHSNALPVTALQGKSCCGSCFVPFFIYANQLRHKIPLKATSIVKAYMPYKGVADNNVNPKQKMI